MLGAHVDVTERNAAEERLRVSEQRFRDVAASADEYIFEMDAQGAITYISDVVENVIGFRPDEIVGQSSLRFVSPAEHARSSAYLGERASRKEKISHFQQEAVHRSGRSVWLDISAVPTLAKDGTLLGYRGAALDVTKRQQAEEERAALQAQLAQAQKLESIGRLAGGVAHDFNNLLTVILGYGAEIQSGLVEGTPPDHESVDEIVAAARRASDLTKQLLAFARKQIVAPVALDLNEAVRESSKLLGRLIGEEIQVVHRLLEDLWSVRCDPGLVGQVIMNLGVNARDAMPGGGTFTLATANVTVPPDVVPPEPEMFPGEYVRFSLDDTGSGMTAEQLGHVFEPFFTTKEPGAGTGLGLATVYGIVKQCGAFVGVTSSPGKGTRFDIYFPRDEGPVVGPEAAPSRSRTGSETVLVVEDDEQVREVAVRALRSGGYRVLAAPGLLPAMEMVSATTEPIHLLVTDVVMPGGGGTDVTERISDLRPGIRVLFMSGYSHGATSRQGVLDEVTEFIPKPFTAAELRSRVRKVLDRTRPPRPQG
jgi:PAS domain S-box-containing protein